MSLKPEEIVLSTAMDEVMASSPDAIKVVLENKMYCAGCFLASFHTVSDAAFEHDLDEDMLLKQLRGRKLKKPGTDTKD